MNLVRNNLVDEMLEGLEGPFKGSNGMSNTYLF